MVFDVASGIYWRPEEGGVLWGMSNPDEQPGEAAEFDWAYYDTVRGRVAELLPATADLGLRRAWAATIDYTPDHLPILGPLIADGEPVAGTVVAAAGGHGMMWGPAVSKVAADLAVAGATDVLDVTDLGLDRFDEHGRSRLAPDPIALPFPEERVLSRAGDDEGVHRDDTVPPDHERVDVDRLQHVAELVGQLGERHDRGDQRLGGQGGAAAVPGQQLPDRRSRATSSAARSVVPRRERDRPLGQQLDQRAAGRHQDQRPDEGVAPHPERHLDPARDLGLHAPPTGPAGRRDRRTPRRRRPGRPGAGGRRRPPACGGRPGRPS